MIVDSGRSSILGTGYQEILHCIRCGACQNVCPVYRQVGGHAYGWVYGGPIGAVLTPLFKPHGRGHGGRARVEPVRGLRRHLPGRDPAPRPAARPAARPGGAAHPRLRLERSAYRAWSYAWSSPLLYRLSGPLGLGPLRLFARSGVLHRAPGFLGRWTRGRDLLLPWRKR